MSYLATILTVLSMNILTEIDQEKIFTHCVFLTELGNKATEQELKYISGEALNICIKTMEK